MSTCILAEELRIKKIKLDELEIKLQKAANELSDAEYELDIAQDAYDEAEEEYDSIEKQKTVLKQEINDIEVNQLIKVDSLTEDPFKDAFIIASWFCSHDEEERRPILCNVRIAEDALYGCDGFRIIKIKTNSIPDDLKNSFVNWKCREQFIKEDVIGEYLHVDEVFSNNYSQVTCSKEYKVTELKDMWIGSGKRYNGEPNGNQRNTLIVTIDGEDIGLNERYLEIMLDAFSTCETVKVSKTCSIGPIFMESENMMALLLPVRIKCDYD